MHLLLWLFLISVGGCLLLALLLHTLPKLGSLGKAISAKCCEAPGLDVVVFCFTSVPQIAGIVLGAMQGGIFLRDGSIGIRLGAEQTTAASWLGALIGLIVGTLAQLFSLWAWCRVHELVHHKVMQRPRIKGSLAKILSRDGKGGFAASWRNYLGVWWTLWAVPIFTFVRIGELCVYPIVSRLVRLPRYRESDWVRVSRQKFDGLVGADLIWCLYCDWMTGVWSLGSEMLRNIESFWCPIRFASAEKCANCTTDFPDIDIDWVRADGKIEDVTSLIEKKYPGPKGSIGGENSWSGHPVRLTVRGK
ncbi:MAG: hypothetical protein U0640_09050 [Phycisphaerales bacterium]